MKKLILFLISLSLGSFSYAWIETYQEAQASYTATNEGPIQISTHGGILDGIIIDTQSPLGTITIADAWVSTIGNQGSNLVSYSTISILSLSGGNNPAWGANYIHFGVVLSSGLTYTTANNKGVTIIWKSFLQPTSGK